MLASLKLRAMVLKKGAIMNLIKGFRLLRVLLLAAIVLFPLSSCTTLPERRVKPNYTVAVLPIYNDTNDIDGPVLVRKVFNEKIQRYYKTIPLKDVDRLLRDQMGITLGGQLEMTTPQKLGEVLDVDGVIYGYLLNFDDIKTVVLNVRRVRAGFKMVDVKSGRIIWAGGEGVRNISGVVPVDFFKGKEPAKIKDIEMIPGINNWRSILPPWTAEYKPEFYTGWSREEVSDSALLSTLNTINIYHLAFGVDFIGKVFNIHLISETKVMINDIIHTIDLTEPHIIPSVPVEPQVPRLFFPAYLVFTGKDFNALMTMTAVNQSSQEGITRKIELAKFGGKLRSNRLSEDGKLSVIVKKEEKRGYLLYPSENKYIEVNLAESDFKDTDVTKKFDGEDNIDGQPCNKYKVRVTYGDGWIQDGFIWEAKNLNGLVVKVDLNDKDARIIMELKDVSFKTPPATLFEVPEGYTKIDY